jgi:hypothetical protein
VITYDDVRRVALSLPAAFEQASYGGQPSWRTKARMFAWIRLDPEALVVWVGSLDEKEMLLEHEPAVHFTTPHYDGLPIVLVRLEAVDQDEAAELLTESWRLRAPRAAVEAWDAEHPGPDGLP